MHTYIHTYMHTYIHACIHTYIHTYIHMCVRVSDDLSLHVVEDLVGHTMVLYMNRYIYIYNIYIYIYHTYACIYIYIYIYILHVITTVIISTGFKTRRIMTPTEPLAIGIS